MQAFEEASGRKVKCEVKPRRPGDAAAVWAATETAEKVQIGGSFSQARPQLGLTVYQWMTPPKKSLPKGCAHVSAGAGVDGEAGHQGHVPGPVELGVDAPRRLWQEVRRALSLGKMDR